MPKQSAVDYYLLCRKHNFSAPRYVYNAGSPFLSALYSSLSVSTLYLLMPISFLHLGEQTERKGVPALYT